MQESFFHYLKDPLALMLAGLGISFAPHVWLGGMFLALSGAAVATRSDPERDTRELWLIFLTAFLVAHMAGMVSYWLWPSFPLQFVMFGAGFMSRKVIRLAMRVGSLVEARGDRIADRLVDRVFPPDPNAVPPASSDKPDLPGE